MYTVTCSEMPFGKKAYTPSRNRGSYGVRVQEGNRRAIEA